jgi:hypothetical protein
VGEFAAKSRRQLGSTKDGLPYAAMLHGHSGPQQPNRQYNPYAKIRIKLIPQPIGVRLSETCPGLCVACLMAPLQAPKELLKVSSPLASDNRRTQFNSRGLRNAWLFDTNTCFMSQWVFSPGKWERLMFVPRTADFRATVSALQSLEGSMGMGFQTFSLSLSLGGSLSTSAG